MAARKSSGSSTGNALVREVVDPWYLRPDPEMGSEIQRLVDWLKTGSAGRRTRYQRNVELFERRRLSGYSAHTYESGTGTEDDEDFGLDRLGLIRSAVASAVSSIYAPQKPKPQFQTMGADWATRRRAYKLDRVCEGVINQEQGRYQTVWSLMVDAGVECALQGTACVWVRADKERGRIVHELVPSVDVLVDPQEGRDPQNFFFRRPLAQDEALRLWPKARRAIEGAKPYEWYGGARASAPRTAKVVEVAYAYRMPTGKDRPGRWACVVNGTVVDSGDWTAPRPPLVFLRWEDQRDGFWASGLGHEGGRMARECGELDLRLYVREVVASGTKVFYEQGTVKPDDLVLNDATVAIPVAPGAAFMPTIQQTVPFSPMELDFLHSKVTSFWDAIGISQVSAAARREQGVQSGVAIMTLNDTKAGRQLLKAQRFEQAFVDLARQYVWRIRELAEDDPSFEVRWTGKALIRSVRWTETDVEDDMFDVTVAPASALPHDPAGRQEMVQDMLKAALISQETAKSLMGWPDLESEMSVETAESEYVDSLIERYLDADPETWTAADYEGPQGFLQDKVGALRRFASAWFRAKVDQSYLPRSEKRKVEFNLGKLTRYMKELDKLMAPPPQGPAPDQLPTPASAPPQAA